MIRFPGSAPSQPFPSGPVKGPFMPYGGQPRPPAGLLAPPVSTMVPRYPGQMPPPQPPRPMGPMPGQMPMGQMPMAPGAMPPMAGQPNQQVVQALMAQRMRQPGMMPVAPPQAY